jgi:hypothetical protein
MVHRGVRRECPECGKVLSDLWKHMRTVHGLYRRRAKIPKEKALGGADGKPGLGVSDVASPSKSSSDNESPPVSAPSTPVVKSSAVSNNNNSGGKKNNNVSKSKNKRKSSPPVKVKMSFNVGKSAKKSKMSKI